MAWLRRALAGAAIAILVFAAVVAGLVAFGGGSPPPRMAAISDPFADIDYGDLPARQALEAADGTDLAYRRYPAAGGTGAPAGAVLALHGSSTDGQSLHVLARDLAAAGQAVYVPDIRGHGDSGPRGDVPRTGILEEDIAAFLALIRDRHPDLPVTLLGFSSGGGLALRYAGRPDLPSPDRLLLLAPMLGIGAPTYTEHNPHAGDARWSNPYVPRIIGLSILNGLGIHAFDDLPVIGFAVDPANDRATSSYSHRLLQSMNPQDYRALLRDTAAPVTVLAGTNDQVFAADQFAPTVHAVRPEADVRLVDGVDHVGMTLDPAALAAVRAMLAAELR
ncbi:alpha/beta hydrolase [Marinibaculum pumilum]|uniref:Alpha/beta hydrolase n=1 Tax=Marinibaculum pumilum TaxID=1766165 RepID=A0ABV7KXW5_9PROT